MIKNKPIRQVILHFDCLLAYIILQTRVMNKHMCQFEVFRYFKLILNNLNNNGSLYMVKFIIPMAKNQTARKEDNLLVIERLKNTCKFPSLTVDFNPILKNGTQFEQIVPVFNNDRNYFTPCFVIKGDKSFFLGSLQFQKLKFQGRVRNSYERNLPNPLSLAEPSSNYCQICRCQFDQYLTHINNAEHQTANRKSQANQMILQLCKQYQNAQRKTKGIKKQVQKPWQIEKQEITRVLRSCKKKVGRQELIGKNFSFISTKINTSQVNGL